MTRAEAERAPAQPPRGDLAHLRVVALRAACLPSSGMHSKHSTRSPYSSIAYSRVGDALLIAFTMLLALGRVGARDELAALAVVDHVRLPGCVVGVHAARQHDRAAHNSQMTNAAFRRDVRMLIFCPPF